MALDNRRKNAQWQLILRGDDSVTPDQAQLAVLMDIRDELQTLNRLLGCHNFTSIPHTLKEIKRNTKRRKRKSSKVKS